MSYKQDLDRASSELDDLERWLRKLSNARPEGLLEDELRKARRMVDDAIGHVKDAERAASRAVSDAERRRR